MSLPRYKEYKASGVEWLGEVPGHWNLRSLRYAATIQNGSDFKDYEVSEGGYPVLGSGGEFARISKFIYDQPSVLLGRKGTIDNPLYIEEPFWTVDTLFYTKIAKDTHPKFFYWFCTSIPFGYFQFGSAVPSMTQNDLYGIKVPTPSLDEQQTVAAFLDRETGKIDALIAEQQRLMDFLTEKVTSLVLSSICAPETQELRLENAATIVSRPVIQREGQSYTPIGLFNRGRGSFHKDAREMADMGDSDFFWLEEGDLIISGQFAWEGAVALAGKEETGCVVSHRYPVLRGKSGITRTEYLLALFSTKHGDFLLNENSRGAAGRNRPLNIKSLLSLLQNSVYELNL
jgi:type I restriction enzyme S subunit